VTYGDLILSGSWDGVIRAWKISEDKRRIESVGIVGPSTPVLHLTNGDSKLQNGKNHNDVAAGPVKPLKGIINSISVFERGDRGQDGLCIVAAVSKEHRLGSWKRVPKGRCEGVVFEASRIKGV
jgi:ribosomal RNA-processing protein 9